MLETISEHIGFLGASGPAAVAMVWKYINNLRTTIESNEQYIREQAEKDKEHTLKIEKLEEQVNFLRVGGEKKEGEGRDAIRELERRIEKRFDEHKENSRANYEKLEGKIDQLMLFLRNGHGHEALPYSHAPVQQEQWRPPR